MLGTNRAMAAEYRYEAARLRTLAETARADNERRSLTEAADLYDYLAGAAETAARKYP
jgi:hypothetical protein